MKLRKCHVECYINVKQIDMLNLCFPKDFVSNSFTLTGNSYQMVWNAY